MFSDNVPFDWKVFPQAFFPILGLFAQDSRYNIKQCSVIFNVLDIECYYRGQKSELMLRFGGSPDAELIVKRIEFVHKRKGYMTQLYGILKDIQRAYHTGPIVIESVLTTEMENWCNKNGFIKDSINPGNYVQVRN